MRKIMIMLGLTSLVILMGNLQGGISFSTKERCNATLGGCGQSSSGGNRKCQMPQSGYAGITTVVTGSGGTLKGGEKCAKCFAFDGSSRFVETADRCGGNVFDGGVTPE